MPIYEYRCNQCGYEMEAIQKLSESPLTSCPVCATESLKKKISAAVFRLKGRGWYETDFKSGDRKRNVAGDDDGGSKEKDNSEKDNSKEKAKTEQSTGSEGAKAKSEKSGQSENKAGNRAKGDSKPSPFSATSSE